VAFQLHIVGELFKGGFHARATSWKQPCSVCWYRK